MKRSSTSLAISEMQIKSTLGIPSRPSQDTYHQNTIKNVSVNVDKKQNSYAQVVGL